MLEKQTGDDFAKHCQLRKRIWAFSRGPWGSRDRVWHRATTSGLCFQELTLALYSALVLGRGCCLYPSRKRDAHRREERGDWRNWNGINMA